jgi:hypothetical protein
VPTKCLPSHTVDNGKNLKPVNYCPNLCPCLITISSPLERNANPPRVLTSLSHRNTPKGASLYGKR